MVFFTSYNIEWTHILSTKCNEEQQLVFNINCCLIINDRSNTSHCDWYHNIINADHNNECIDLIYRLPYNIRYIYVSSAVQHGEPPLYLYNNNNSLIDIDDSSYINNTDLTYWYCVLNSNNWEFPRYEMNYQMHKIHNSSKTVSTMALNIQVCNGYILTEYDLVEDELNYQICKIDSNKTVLTLT